VHFSFFFFHKNWVVILTRTCLDVAQRHRRYRDGEQRSRQGNPFENDATRSEKRALASLSSGYASGKSLTLHQANNSRSIGHRRVLRYRVPPSLAILAIYLGPPGPCTRARM